jgi:TetR/AcrR family transcriptional repressor of nem operon
MGRPSLREAFIEAGVATVHQQGFIGSGVREIAAAAGAPQGSFISHFGSKEGFGVAVLDRYLERTQAIFDATLSDETRGPLARLDAYFDAITAVLEGAGWRHGCMISNMTLETSEHSERLRLRLVAIFDSLTQSFADVLRAGQRTGEIRTDYDAEELADVLLAAWHGAMLRMKAERDGRAIGRFRRLVLPTLLAS